MADWISLESSVFDDSIRSISCDTRDFGCIMGYDLEDTPYLDLDKVKKYPDFFYTIQEVEAILKDLYERSCGPGEWRMLTFKDNGSYISTGNWNLQYIRIYKTKFGYVMCDASKRMVRKGFWDQQIDKEYLAHHDITKDRPTKQ
jgi:hypothetical protein